MIKAIIADDKKKAGVCNMSDYRKFTELADNTWHISEATSSMYLLIGGESALLIDTAYGISDITKEIKEITLLPLKVVLTHGHPDHAGGIGHFKKIYMHNADIKMVKNITLDMLRFLLGAATGKTDYELKPLNSETEFIPISDGFTFGLGGRKVMTYETPGHTYGSLVFIDSLTNLLFSGDACNHNLLLDYPEELKALMPLTLDSASVETCLKSLLKMKEFADTITGNCTGHLDEIMGKPAGPSTLNDCIFCCEKILQGTAQIIELEMAGMNYKPATYGTVMVCFDQNKLYENK